MAGGPRFAGLQIASIVLGGFGGILFTWLPAMTPDDWSEWVGCRLFLQLGCTAWLVVLLALRGSRVREIVGVLGFGLLLSWNALRSLATGPVVVEGIAVEFQAGHGGRSGFQVHLGVQDGRANTTRLTASWEQGRHAIALLGACARKDTRVRVTLLVPLGAMLAAECLDPVSVTERRRAREAAKLRQG